MDSLSVKRRGPFDSPIDLESLRATHSGRYLRALFAGEPRSLATSQGLPTWNENIARGWLLNIGGLYAAGEAALHKKTITANLGHRYPHATVNRGMRFCTINGLVVVAKKLIHEAKAKRVMIIDLDHHEGNGTAEGIIGDPLIWNVSLSRLEIFHQETIAGEQTPSHDQWSGKGVRHPTRATPQGRDVTKG
jgi:acetoin utilization deacetylase AcuC-like enzyme